MPYYVSNVRIPSNIIVSSANRLTAVLSSSMTFANPSSLRSSTLTWANWANWVPRFSFAEPASKRARPDPKPRKSDIDPLLREH